VQTTKGVEGENGRGLGEAVALDNLGFGHSAPALRNGGLQGHSASRRVPEVLRGTFAKPSLVHQSVEEGVHSGDPGDLVVLEGSLEVARWTGAWNKQVAPPR